MATVTVKLSGNAHAYYSQLVYYLLDTDHLTVTFRAIWFVKDPGPEYVSYSLVDVTAPPEYDIRKLVDAAIVRINEYYPASARLT